MNRHRRWYCPSAASASSVAATTRRSRVQQYDELAAEEDRRRTAARRRGNRRGRPGRRRQQLREARGGGRGRPRNGPLGALAAILMAGSADSAAKAGSAAPEASRATGAPREPSAWERARRGDGGRGAYSEFSASQRAARDAGPQPFSAQPLGSGMNSSTGLVASHGGLELGLGSRARRCSGAVPGEDADVSTLLHRPDAGVDRLGPPDAETNSPSSSILDRALRSCEMSLCSVARVADRGRHQRDDGRRGERDARPARQARMELDASSRSQPTRDPGQRRGQAGGLEQYARHAGKPCSTNATLRPGPTARPCRPASAPCRSAATRRARRRRAP